MRTILMTMLALSLTACGSLSTMMSPAPDAIDLDTRAKKVKEQVKHYSPHERLVQDNLEATRRLFNTVALHKDLPVVVATGVDIDDLDSASRFGRLLSEHVASGLSEQSYRTIEMKARKNVMFKPDGEFFLSRDAKDLSASHKAQAVVVPTYAKAQDAVFVTLKLLDPRDGLVLSSVSYALPMTTAMRSLTAKPRQAED